MTAPSPTRLVKLMHKIRSLIAKAEKCTDPLVGRTIREWYYVQKARELELLHIHYEEAISKISAVEIAKIYREILVAWRRDALWLHRFELSRRCVQEELTAHGPTKINS